MSLDVGSRKIGIAVSDVLCYVAQGLTVIDRDKSFSEIKEIEKIVEQYQVDEIIVGMPRLASGVLGKQAKATEDYVTKLREELSTPVKSWDERLTTSLAKKTLVEADISRKKRKEVIDKVAAAIILQSYLDNTSN